MNERIRELLLKAGFTNAYTDPEEGFELVFVDEEHTTKSVAKFAELIVRECADVLVVEMTRLDGLDRVVASQTMDTAQVLIKQHFGVE
jgi:hypothetical protein